MTLDPEVGRWRRSAIKCYQLGKVKLDWSASVVYGQVYVSLSINIQPDKLNGFQHFKHM